MEHNQMKIKHLILIILSLIFVVPAVYADDYQDGMDAFIKKDFKAALKKLKPLAEKGHAKAQYRLGLSYERGKGVSEDYKEAAKWYQLAGEQGFANAQYRLGFLYEKGQGVPQDYKEAVKWCRLSAEQGDVEAQFTLGLMYDFGQGVPQDYALAHMWFNLCGSSGDVNCVDKRNIVEKKMTKQQIEKAQEMARNWKPKK